MIELTIREMTEKNLNYQEKFGQALKDGFFYMEIPESIKSIIHSANTFAENLRNNEILKTFQLGPHLGYQERQNTQAVAFVAMNQHWEQVFPKEVVEIAQTTNKLAIDILKNALEYLAIPEKFWEEVTGGLTTNQGSNVFSFNHYQPDSTSKLGLIPHKDMGWVTILFINQIGLETSLEGKEWISIPPKEGYFVVNFGRAFEILANSPKLKASLHRVVPVVKERMSYGYFGNHAEGTDMYEMNALGSPVKIGTYTDYLSRMFAEFGALQQQLSQANIQNVT